MADIPPASGTRVDWPALPEPVRQAVERALGSPVISAVTQPGGFSPGAAARLVTQDGQRAFVKAVGPALNPVAPRFHRREAQVVRLLPASAPVPRLLWSDDDLPDGWVALLFDDVDGRQPSTPWRDDELDQVLAAISTLSAALTPSPIPRDAVGEAHDWFARNGRGWSRFQSEPHPALDDWSVRYLDALAVLEADAPAGSVGETLLHFDLRADNLLLTERGVVVVDWPHARIGAPWVDLVLMAPSVEMQGGPPADQLLARHPASRTADPAAVNAVIAAVAGFFSWHALQPPLPGLPTLRPFQAAQGQIARRWLAERRGWR